MAMRLTIISLLCIFPIVPSNGGNTTWRPAYVTSPLIMKI